MVFSLSPFICTLDYHAIKNHLHLFSIKKLTLKLRLVTLIIIILKNGMNGNLGTSSVYALHCQISYSLAYFLHRGPCVYWWQRAKTFSDMWIVLQPLPKRVFLYGLASAKLQCKNFHEGKACSRTKILTQGQQKRIKRHLTKYFHSKRNL